MKRSSRVSFVSQRTTSSTEHASAESIFCGASMLAPERRPVRRYNMCPPPAAINGDLSVWLGPAPRAVEACRGTASPWGQFLHRLVSAVEIHEPARIDTMARPQRRLPHYKAMIVAPQPEAAEAGLITLKAGGNALDAVIACALTQGVVD